jgi:hypothetical protein
MTVERKIVVGLEDITAITLECECGGRMTFKPELFRTIPNNCAHCGKVWMNPDRPFEPASGVPAALWFILSLRDLRTLIREKSLPFKVLLEFSEPKNNLS